MFLKLSSAIFLSLASPIVVAIDVPVASLMCLALDGTVDSCCTEDSFTYDGVCAILSCLDGLSIREGCSCYDIETACELLAGFATDIIAEYATDIAYETAKDIADMCDMVGECCADDGTTTTNIEWEVCMAEAAGEVENFVPDIVELLLGSIPGIPGGLPDLVPTGSIASLTCLALNGTVASCCTEDDVPNDGVCAILSCLDGLSIREGCSCFDIETGCELLAAYMTDFANAMNIANITDITDMCGMVGECCADDGNTITNIEWEFCMAEAVEEANFETTDIVELLLGIIPGVLLHLIPTGSTSETGGIPSTSSAPTATAATNDGAPTKAPSETPGNGTGVDNPCIICPDGTDVDDFAPYAANGDFRTCEILIDEAKSYETGTDYCGWFELFELRCCFTAPEIPCNICPDGATAGDDYAPYKGSTTTCSDLIKGAKQFESGSDACGFIDIVVAFCCPPEVTPAPTSTPDTTLATTTVSPTSAPEVDNPCIICPNGASAGYDDFQPLAGAGEMKTCKELLDGMTNVSVEGGSDLCDSMREIEALCCLDVDSAPSPTQPSPTSPALGGGASVSGLVGFTFFSIASTLCVIACM